MSDATPRDRSARPSPPWAAYAAVTLAVATLALLFRDSGAGAWIELLFRLFTDGLPLLAWIAAAGGLGYPIVRPLIGRDATRDEPLLTIAMSLGAGIGALSLLTLGLGLPGLLTPTTAWLLIVTGAALALAWIALAHRPRHTAPSTTRDRAPTTRDRELTTRDREPTTRDRELTSRDREPTSRDREGAVSPSAARATTASTNHSRASTTRDDSTPLVEVRGGAFLPSTDVPPPLSPNAPAPLASTLALLPLALLGAMLLVAALVAPGLLWREEPHPYDVLSYHLQVPREWHEIGRIVPLPHNVFSHFPFNVEMHFLLAMHLRGGAHAGMYLAQLTHAAMVAIVPFAVFAALRPRGPLVASAAALLAGSFPWMLLLGGVAYNEGGLLLFATLAAIAAMRAQAGGSVRLAILAGLFAGFACGAKLTAVPTVLLAIPVAMVVAETFAPRRAGERPRAIGRSLGLAAALVVAGLLAFSPWLARNAAWTGNPVFPERMEWLGRAHFDDAQVERWRVAHGPRDDQRSIGAKLSALVQHTTLDWRGGFVLGPLLLAAVALGLVARTRESILLATLLAMLVVFWLAFTHLQGRFLVIAIPLATLSLGSLPLVASRVAIAVALVAAVVTITRAGPELATATAALGLDDLTPLARMSLGDERLADRVFAGTAPVVLVGDAKAFLYPIPMTRLGYRTVFDVPGDRWLGDVPADAIVIRDPAELSRLKSTYRRLPEAGGNHR
jgi:hypothetical protein